MTTNRKVPIEEQVNGVNRAIYHALDRMTHLEREQCQGALKFLRWCQDHPDILHTASLIWKDDMVRQVREVFPGATLADVRKLDAEYTDD